MMDAGIERRPLANVRIAGIACAVPGPSVPVLGPDAGAELQKVTSSTGVSSRHVALPDVCTSDLCQAAAERLCVELSWDMSTIDLLVFVSQTPDAVLPSTACILHGKLGLSAGCAAFDVNLGCSGYVYGLQLVASLINSGQARRALLLVGDTISKVTSPVDRSVALLFGDAGSATCVEFTDQPTAMTFVLGTDGSGAPHLQIPAGGFRQPRSNETAAVVSAEGGNARSAENLFMNGPEIFNFTLARVPALIAAVIAQAKWVVADVDAFVFHQANKFMLDHIVKRMKLPKEAVLMELAEVGNTSSASIPLAIVTGLRERITREPMRLVLAGFGVGFSWAGLAWSSDRPVVLPLIQT